MHRSLPGVYCGLTPPSVAFIGALCASRIACPCLLTCSSRPPAACVLLRQSHAPSLTTSRRASPSLGTSPASSRVRRCPPSQAYRRVPSGDASSTTSPETSCSSASISGGALQTGACSARRAGRCVPAPSCPARPQHPRPASPPPVRLPARAREEGHARVHTAPCRPPPRARERRSRPSHHAKAVVGSKRAEQSAAQRSAVGAVPCRAARRAPRRALPSWRWRARDLPPWAWRCCC